MTVVIAGALEKRGFIMTDTRLKYSRDRIHFKNYDKCKKIYYNEEYMLFNCGYGVSDVDEKYNKLLKGRTLNVIDDYNECYYEAINRVKIAKKYPEDDIESSVLTQMQLRGSVSNPRIGIEFMLLDTEINKVVSSHSNQCIVWLPSEYDRRNESYPFRDGDFFEALIESVNRFIKISDESDNVSNICSLAYMDCELKKIAYYEEDMQVMKSFLCAKNLPLNKMGELLAYQQKLCQHGGVLNLIE